MKSFLKSAIRNPRSAIAALALLIPGAAHCQNWSVPSPYATNAITWLPQPQTNVPVTLVSLPQHSIKVQNYNLASTNNVTNNFFISIDATNKIPYLIASVNGATGNYGNSYIATGPNAVDTIVFAATNVPIYGAVQCVVGTNATTSLAAQNISTVY